MNVRPWALPAAITSAVDRLGWRRMKSLFETPADFAVPGVVVLGAAAFFEAGTFFAIFLAGLVGFEVLLDTAGPRTLDTFFTLVSYPPALALAITSATGVSRGRLRMKFVRSEGGRGMSGHGSGFAWEGRDGDGLPSTTPGAWLTSLSPAGHRRRGRHRMGRTRLSDLDTTRHVSLTIRSVCDHCGGPLPLLGPLRTVACAACSKETRFSADDWGIILNHVAAHGDLSCGVGSHDIEARVRGRSEPACAACAALMPLDRLAVGTDGATICACGATLTTYPAPYWLATLRRAGWAVILQVYGADRESDGAAPSVVAADSRASAPVVMACPSCGGSLNLTGESQRATRCTFCQTSVYLPDALWRILHPVKTVRAWSIAYAAGK